MKKLMCLFLVLCVVLSLSACADAERDNDSEKIHVKTTLTKEKLQGTWLLTVSLKEKLPAVFSAMNEAEEITSKIPQETIQVLTKGIPSDAVLEILVVFDASGYRMVIDGEKLNSVMLSTMKSIVSVEVLTECFRLQNLSEEDIRQRCGGLSVEEYVELLHQLYEEQIDFTELFSKAEDTTVKDGLLITTAEDYRIKGNTLYMQSGETELCLKYDGQKLILKELVGAEDNDVVSALLPIDFQWVSTKTEY